MDRTPPEPFRRRYLRIRRLEPADFLQLRRVRVFAAADSGRQGGGQGVAALLVATLHG